MEKSRNIHFTAILLTLLLWSFACQLVQQSAIQADFGPIRKIGPIAVAQVVDGDTIRLVDGTLVRLIGVDTPESNHPEVPVQRFAEEARQFLENKIEQFPVTLEVFTRNEKDKYGRLLAYVYLGEKLLNAEIIKRGYGYAYTRFPFSKLDEFVDFEREARGKQYGLWNYSLTDGRVTHILNQYDSLSNVGKQEYDRMMSELIKKYSKP